MVTGLLLCQAIAKSIDKKEDIDLFINKMVTLHGFDKTYLTELFKKVHIQHHVINAMNKPAEAKPWQHYQNFFVLDEGRFNAGLKFWQEHEQTLTEAEQQYGVPAEIIVAILGIETQYGNNVGKHRVINALSTLAFAYPNRAPYFKRELEEYLLLSRENNFDPFELRGSYAGAIGLPQFMPSSYRHYAISYNGNEKKDLLNNPNDAIFSIANFLKSHGWSKQQTIVAKTTVQGEQYREIMPPPRKYKPTLSLKELSKYGINTTTSMPQSTKAIILELDAGQHKEYWLGFQNFYTITRYNVSENYAMAVYQLSEKFKSGHQKLAKDTSQPKPISERTYLATNISQANTV